jgi:hypothetical protein
MTDRLIDALAAANPVAPGDFAPPPPLRALPRRRAVSPRLALVPAVAALVALAVALLPSGSPGGARVLAPALAQGGGVLYWRVEGERGGAYELWMRVDGDEVTSLRELRADGLESVIRQPHGLGDTAGAVTRERRGPDGPIRTARGIAYDTAFAEVVQAARRAARGALDLRAATATTYAGRAAYAVRLPDAIGPSFGRHEVTYYAVTMWVARDGGTPLAVRWANGERVWRTLRIDAFERLPDDPRLLELR